MFFRPLLVSLILSTSVEAEQINPLEGIGIFTAATMTRCMMSENNVWHCFEATIDECNAYVAGFAHNIYPCSTNTRTALTDLVESRIREVLTQEQLVDRFRNSQRKGYEMCHELHQLSSAMGQPRVGTHVESCLNVVATQSSGEVWSAVQFAE